MVGLAKRRAEIAEIDEAMENAFAVYRRMLGSVL
jgi:hypothetical protein